jgi:hypothetical protein
MDPKTKYALSQPSTYLSFSVIVIAVLSSHRLFPDAWLPYVDSYVAILGTYGIVGALRQTAPRTPWDSSQRDAFRNTHPEVQEEVK